MPDHKQEAYQQLVNRFWHNYLFLLEKHSIHVKARLWYRNHFEDYISSYQGVKLQQHLTQHFDNYQTTNGGVTKLPEWQFRQIAEALRLLIKKPKKVTDLFSTTSCAATKLPPARIARKNSPH